MKYKPLADLPNQEGFEFVALDCNGIEHDCTIAKNRDGQHFVREFMGRRYGLLEGWREKTAA